MNDGNNVRCSLMWQVHYISGIACRKLIPHMTLSITGEKKKKRVLDHSTSYRNSLMLGVRTHVQTGCCHQQAISIIKIVFAKLGISFSPTIGMKLHMLSHIFGAIVAYNTEFAVQVVKNNYSCI